MTRMLTIRSLLPALLALPLLMPGSILASSELAARYSPEAWQAQRQHAGVKVLSSGDGTERAYIFLPDTPGLSKLPLVLFHHGWLGMNPKNFGSLIDLMARRGAVVIFPVYQDGDKTAPQQVTELAGRANARALSLLEKLYPGLVERQRTLYWGFSMGASISLNLALKPERFGLPAPQALLLLAPGDAHHVAKGERARSIIGPLESLRGDLPVLLATGATDSSIGVPTARSIAARLCHLPSHLRNLILLPSDSNGERRITAGHGSPGAPDSDYDFPDAQRPISAHITGKQVFEPSGSLNLLDFYAYWRMSMGLLDYVAGGEFPSILFSRTAAENRFLGYWPDGRAYAEAQIEDPCP